MAEDLPQGDFRSETEVGGRRARGGLAWRAVRAIHRRRPLLTALVVLAAPLHTLLSDARPVDLLSPSSDPRFVLAWLFLLLGVLIRIWGSGNLRKNQEITQTGVYSLVQHPLYVGSLSMFLAFFLTVGDPLVGIALFTILVFVVYYPTMLGEEEFLETMFPDQAAARGRLPRLLPNPARCREARRTERFTLAAAYDNLGLRSLWFILALPLFLRLLIHLQTG